MARSTTAADVTGVPTPGPGLPARIVIGAADPVARIDESNAHTGERFVASRWDESLPLAERMQPRATMASIRRGSCERIAYYPPTPLPFSASPISSRMTGSSMVAGIVHGSPSAIFFIVPRRIFPERASAAAPPRARA